MARGQEGGETAGDRWGSDRHGTTVFALPGALVILAQVFILTHGTTGRLMVPAWAQRAAGGALNGRGK